MNIINSFFNWWLLVLSYIIIDFSWLLEFLRFLVFYFVFNVSDVLVVTYLNVMSFFHWNIRWDIFHPTYIGTYTRMLLLYRWIIPNTWNQWSLLLQICYELAFLWFSFSLTLLQINIFKAFFTILVNHRLLHYFLCFIRYFILYFFKVPICFNLSKMLNFWMLKFLTIINKLFIFFLLLICFLITYYILNLSYKMVCTWRCIIAHTRGQLVIIVLMVQSLNRGLLFTLFYILYAWSFWLLLSCLWTKPYFLYLISILF